MRRIALALSLVVLAAAPASGQSRIFTALDTAVVTVGDRMTLTVSVEHEISASVLWPDSVVLEPFEVLEAGPASTEAGAAAATSTWRLVVTAFDLGELELPSFDVEVLHADGDTEVLPTDAFAVVVESVGGDDSPGVIRDIRGLLGIPVSVWRVALLLLAFLFVSGLAYGLVRRLRSGSREAPLPALGALRRPAHEVALDALEALQVAGLLERGEVKEYHIRLSSILRTYVEDRFRVDAHEMTTREVLSGLERVGVGGSFREGLHRLLDACDLVKFAKVRPTATDATESLGLGRQLVLDSKPRFEHERPEAGEVAVAAGDVG